MDSYLVGITMPIYQTLRVTFGIELTKNKPDIKTLKIFLSNNTLESNFVHIVGPKCRNKFQEPLISSNQDSVK